MKKNKFVVLGINAVFDTYDKSRFYGSYAQFVVQAMGEMLEGVSKLFTGGNPLVTNANPNEADSFIKMQDKNLKSFRARLNLLGQSDFCAWAVQELNKDKQFAYGVYSLIESKEITENENFNLLKEAICNSLKRNNFKIDYSKPYPNDYKEFVESNHYDDNMIIMKLESSINQNKKSNPKLR